MKKATPLFLSSVLFGGLLFASITQQEASLTPPQMEKKINELLCQKREQTSKYKRSLKKSLFEAEQKQLELADHLVCGREEKWKCIFFADQLSHQKEGFEDKMLEILKIPSSKETSHCLRELKTACRKKREYGNSLKTVQFRAWALSHYHPNREEKTALAEKWIKSVMKNNGLSRKQAIERINEEIEQDVACLSQILDRDVISSGQYALSFLKERRVQGEAK